MEGVCSDFIINQNTLVIANMFTIDCMLHEHQSNETFVDFSFLL